MRSKRFNILEVIMIEIGPNLAGVLENVGYVIGMAIAVWAFSKFLN